MGFTDRLQRSALSRAAVRLPAGAGALFAFVLFTASCGDDAPVHDDPPVTVATTGSGSLKLTTTIQLGGDSPIVVQLDTGSTGLRIDPAALPSGIATFGPSTTQEFGGNRALKGPTAMVPITIGSSTSEPIAVQVVETVECGSVSACRTDRGVSGFADLDGIQGLMGIGLDPDGVQGGVFNPLIQLPSPFSSGFVFELGTGGGSLTLGPASAPARAVVVDVPAGDTLPDGQRGWEDHHLPLCWNVGTATGCGFTILDTGGTSPVIPESFFSGSLPAGTVPPGTAVTLVNGGGETLWSFSTSSRPEQVSVEEGSGSDQEANAGIGIFLWADSVGYDVSAGQIWVLPPGS